MKKYFQYYITILVIHCSSITFGQPNSTILLKYSDTVNHQINRPSPSFKNDIRWSAIIAPSIAMTYGFVKLGNNALTRLDKEAKHEFYSEHPHRKFVVDNYLQFAPGAAVFALNGLGVKGKNHLIDQSGVYLISNVILNAACQSLKRITAVTRPDGTSNAFPSGHTAEAFASAEFLRQEYGGASSWYAISGYSSAVAVGILRMYNNKHWLSDVVAGAGLGVLSTQASYWLYPKIRKLFARNRKSNALILPSYNHGSFGAGMVKTF